MANPTKPWKSEDMPACSACGAPMLLVPIGGKVRMLDQASDTEFECTKCGGRLSNG